MQVKQESGGKEKVMRFLSSWERKGMGIVIIIIIIITIIIMEVYLHSLLTSELGSDSGRSSTSIHWTRLSQVSFGNKVERKMISIHLYPEGRGSIFLETFLFTYCIELRRNR
jgi:hypothetical protein